MFNSRHLQQFIDAQRIEATIIHLTENTPTVPDAARALGVPEAQIIKSLVFLVNGNPILVIANGSQRIDTRNLANHFGVGRKRIKFASAAQALEITGYIVGSMPPFGHKTALPTFIDSQVATLPVIYGGGGDIHAMLKLASEQLLQATNATCLPVSESTSD